MVSKIQKQLREKLEDDITELNKPLQLLLEESLEKGQVMEEDIIAEIDDMDSKIKMLEKFYDLAEKLSIKIVTIEEKLEEEIKEEQKESRLGKILLFEQKSKLRETQHKDFIKLYFNDISKIPLLSAEEERDIARRIKK
jgi:RNA polymerase primary sigma factor